MAGVKLQLACLHHHQGLFQVSTHLTQLLTCGRSFREHSGLALCSLTSQHLPTTHNTMHLFNILATFMHNVGWSPSHSSLRALVIVLCALFYHVTSNHCDNIIVMIINSFYE